MSRFEFRGKQGIYDNLSTRYITLDGEIIQVKGLGEIRFSDSSKELLNAFIKNITPDVERLTKEFELARKKSNAFYEFNLNLNEGYAD